MCRKGSALGRTKAGAWQEMCLGMEELREGTELRGAAGAWREELDAWGVPQGWFLCLQGCQGALPGSSSLCHPFPALPSAEDEEPW